MTYKTILVYVDQSQCSAARLKVAINIAKREQAHLIGLAATGLPHQIFGEGSQLAIDPVVAASVERLRDRNESALHQFEKAARNAEISFEKIVADDDAAGALIRYGRYSDLIVVSQIDVEDPATNLSLELPDHLVLNAGRPVLIVPHSGSHEALGNEIVVAWDGSPEAIRAVTDALPLLQKSRRVRVVCFNPGKQPAIDGELAGNDIALYLARHDVKVEVLRTTTTGDIGNALLSLAADCESNLIVMGAYGHSRFREAMLGGITRTLLDSMIVPVLMSH